MIGFQNLWLEGASALQIVLLWMCPSFVSDKFLGIVLIRSVEPGVMLPWAAKRAMAPQYLLLPPRGVVGSLLVHSGSRGLRFHHRQDSKVTREAITMTDTVTPIVILALLLDHLGLW